MLINENGNTAVKKNKTNTHFENYYQIVTDI